MPIAFWQLLLTLRPMTRREQRIAELIGGFTDDQFVQLWLEIGSLLETYIPAEFRRGQFGAVLDDFGGAERILARALARVRGQRR